jgi:hypothetical protein
VQSVTEEEVVNGIIYNSKRNTQTFFFDREYTNIDTNNTAEASKWIDMKGKHGKSTRGGGGGRRAGFFFLTHFVPFYFVTN